MRLLVCGTSDFSDYALLSSKLDEIVDTYNTEGSDVVLLNGCDLGPDSMAQAWAEERGYKVEVFAAKWKGHGIKDNPMRHAGMITKGKPDLVANFAPKGITCDMTARAHVAKIPVLQCA